MYENLNAEAKINFTAADLAPIISLKDGKIAIKTGYNIIDIEPVRVKINEKFSNADDFIKFVQDYKTNETKIFYNMGEICAIFNYPSPQKPGYGDSKAILDMVHTKKFNDFKNFIIKSLSQEEFIRFLKGCESSIKSPDTVSLIKISQNLCLTKEIKSVNTNTSKNISINSEMRSGNSETTVIPSEFTLELPIYKQVPDAKTTFKAELFYNFKEGKEFEIAIKCWDFDEIVEEETRRIVQRIIQKLNIPAFMA